ncbi:MAG: hypothetical protein ACOX60_01810 [Massiliimalia sp.]|jgi:hypothetical protein
MICEKCGREYEGQQCPYCSQQENSPTESADFAADTPDLTAKGVYSDTIYKPEWEQRNSNSQTPQGTPSSHGWNRIGDVSQGTFSNETKCPICGYPVTGNFCQRCGTANPNTHPASENAPFSQQQNVYGQQPFSSPGYGGFQTVPNQNYFRENYHRAIEQGRFPKKSQTAAVLLIILGVLLKLMSAGSSILVSLNSEYWADEIMDSYYEDYYDYYDDGMEDNWVDTSDSGDGFKDYVRDDAVDTGESVMPNGVSLEEFRQLELGMTYPEISYIIGGDAAGQETNEQDRLITLWPGEYRIDAVVRVTFDEDGQAIVIEQNGLDDENV